MSELVRIPDITLTCDVIVAKGFTSPNPTLSLGKWECGLIISKNLLALTFEGYFQSPQLALALILLCPGEFTFYGTGDGANISGSALMSIF